MRCRRIGRSGWAPVSWRMNNGSVRRSVIRGPCGDLFILGAGRGIPDGRRFGYLDEVGAQESRKKKNAGPAAASHEVKAGEVAFMPFARLDGVLGYARRLAARSAVDRPADAELVARWVGQRDEAAFEL